jgi:ADP-heptose:LPS heptosyltransferase
MFDTFRFKGYEFLLAPCRPISVRECYKNQAFIKFGKVVPEKAYDVVIHARGRPHCADHNWPRERWEELIDKLTHEGLRCVAVGLMEASMGYFQLAADMRGVPLKETMDIIASSKVMVGPSSGPMCLSSLCGTPHVVWGDKGRYSGTTIKERFETAWNPFKTPCTVLDTGWQPSVDSVFKEVMEHVRKPKTTDESCKV